MESTRSVTHTLVGTRKSKTAATTRTRVPATRMTRLVLRLLCMSSAAQNSPRARGMSAPKASVLRMVSRYFSR